MLLVTCVDEVAAALRLETLLELGHRGLQSGNGVVLKPVSYTHLDVYKRQSEGRGNVTRREPVGYGVGRTEGSHAQPRQERE